MAHFISYCLNSYKNYPVLFSNHLIKISSFSHLEGESENQVRALCPAQQTNPSTPGQRAGLLVSRNELYVRKHRVKGNLSSGLLSSPGKIQTSYRLL